MSPAISNAHVGQLANSAQVIRLVAARQTDRAHRAALDLTAHTIESIANAASAPRPAAKPAEAQTAASSAVASGATVEVHAGKARRPAAKKEPRLAEAKAPAAPQPAAAAAGTAA